MKDEPTHLVDAPECLSLGMTLRDYFAAMALSHVFTQTDGADNHADRAAAWAYTLADAMMEARKK